LPRETGGDKDMLAALKKAAAVSVAALTLAEG
jgi:hypothetical protein